MIISEKNRREISKYLFQEGVCYAKKDYNLAKHPEIDVPNLQVIKLMQSFKSKEYVRETFAWMHYYWYLTNDGIEFLRTYLNLPSEIVPATLKKSAKPLGRPMGGPPGDRPRGPPRFDGDRPRFGDRDGYRGGPRGQAGEFGGEKGGAPADFQPSFRGGEDGGRPGFGRDVLADKCGKREKDFEMSLHSLEEVEEMKKAFLRQIANQREPEPPPPRHTSPSSDKVLAKVAAFESRLSRNGKEVTAVAEFGKLMGDVKAMAATPATRGLGKCLKYGRGDGEMEESTAAATHTSNQYQQKVLAINDTPMPCSEKELLAVNHGKEGLSYFKNIPPHAAGLGDCAILGKDNNNATSPPNSESLILMADNLMQEDSWRSLIDDGQPVLEKDNTTNNRTPLALKSGRNFNAEQASLISGNAENNGSESSSIERKRLTAGHGEFNAEKNAILDLAEARSLVEQNMEFGLHTGPPLLGSGSHSLGQPLRFFLELNRLGNALQQQP
ncbi:hypothetical protein SASPL_157183 [Salvia splendens]|uniref:Plectin/eS10 N-terminal domain-containing protein n=1 Tax=Salvia splendens TaxID=180675 RepID=A0A8X8VVD7_SALSN|nr:hypothetical protein SASPL_157183 [Salvia splendens]